MTELLVSTGIRVGELTALTLVDVNINERVLRIHGKGGKERPAFLTDDTTFAALSQYLEIRRRIKLAHERLFVNARSTPLSEQGVAYVLEELGKRATLPLRLTPHMLRHTAATLFLQNGADIRLVQEFLGHSSIITTQRYAHVTRDHLRSALSTLFPGKLLHA